MAKDASISLDAHFADFVGRQLRNGRYQTASDVVAAGLRLLEQQEAKTAALQKALVGGEESGPPMPFDSSTLLAALHAKHGR